MPSGDTPALSDWNDALAARFFRPERAGQQVFLFVAEEVLEDVAREFGLTPADFISAVRGSDASHVASRAANLCGGGRWRGEGRGVYPPYIAHLCLFVFAAVADYADDLAPNSYYPRLRRVLDLPEDGGALPDFGRLSDEVWSDLEEWSVHDMGGDFGVFRKRVFGEMCHVGVPRSQTLITEAEIADLPVAFALGMLDAVSPPSDQLLVDTLLESGSMRAKTCSILERGASDEMRRAVLEVVRDELIDWDGRVSNATDDSGEVFGGVHLCIEPDAAGASGCSYLRCTIGVTYPESPLELDGMPSGPSTCEEMASAWSTRLSRDGDALNAADAVDWRSGFELVERDLGWHFRWRSAQLRIFEEGASVGISGWVEASRLRRDRPMLIAYPDELSTQIEAWATTCTQSFTGQGLTGALPKGWSAITADGISSAGGLGNLLPAADFTEHVFLRLEAGLKLGLKARYLTYAPPFITLSGGRGDEIVSINDEQLTSGADGRFHIGPAHLCEGERLTVVATRSGTELARRTLSFEEEPPWADSAASVVVNSAGSEVVSEPGICGAVVAPELIEPGSRFSRSVLIPMSSAVLVGRNPGEISDWPEDGLPEWRPVWAIGSPTRGRREKPVVFCGTDPASEAPYSEMACGELRDRKQWSREIWGQKKRLKKPSVRPLAELWSEYEAVARR